MVRDRIRIRVWVRVRVRVRVRVLCQGFGVQKSPTDPTYITHLGTCAD